MIPNATLFTETVRVSTAFGKLRSTYEIQLKAVDDIEEARNELLDAIRGAPDVPQDPEPEVLVSGVDEGKVTLSGKLVDAIVARSGNAHSPQSAGCTATRTYQGESSSGHGHTMTGKAEALAGVPAFRRHDRAFCPQHDCGRCSVRRATTC